MSATAGRSPTPEAPQPRAAADRDASAAVDFERQLAKARKRRAKRQRQMQRAADRGQWEVYRRRRWRYLTSPGVKLAALAEANKPQPRPKRLNPDQLQTEARALNLWRPEDEEVRVTARPKSTGAWRFIHAFGLRRSAMNRIATEAMRPGLKFHPTQYGIRGRCGRHEACVALAQAIEEGYRWIIITDIADCFSSFLPSDVLAAAPLPKRITTNVILPSTMRLTYGRLPNHILRPSSVCGCPQGAATSALLVDAMLAEAIARLPHGSARVSAISDNIAIAVRTKAEVAPLFTALRSAFAEGRTRTLSLRVIRIGRRADHGFEFLGYRFRARYGRVEMKPSAANLQRFNAAFWRRWRLAIVDRNERRKLRGYVASWSAAFRMWGAADGLRAVMLEQVERAAALGHRLARLAPHAVA